MINNKNLSLGRLLHTDREEALQCWLSHCDLSNSLFSRPRGLAAIAKAIIMEANELDEEANELDEEANELDAEASELDEEANKLDEKAAIRNFKR